MFRPMRKERKALSQDTVNNILHTARRGVLAMNGDDCYPYAVPLNYIYDEENQKIYFHGSMEGHKSDAIKACDKVCFTVCGEEIIAEEKWAPFMQSVVLFGRCRIVGDRQKAMVLLKQLAMKYYPDETLADNGIARSGSVTQMYEISIEHITGKIVQEK